MMRLMQLVTLGLFALFAILTAFFQLRVGMTSGDAAREHTRADQDPAVGRSRHGAITCAALAGICLAACIVLGALSR